MKRRRQTTGVVWLAKACMSEALWRSLHGRVFLFIQFFSVIDIPAISRERHWPKSMFPLGANQKKSM